MGHSSMNYLKHLKQLPEINSVKSRYIIHIEGFECYYINYCKHSRKFCKWLSWNRGEQNRKQISTTNNKVGRFSSQPWGLCLSRQIRTNPELDKIKLKIINTDSNFALIIKTKENYRQPINVLEHLWKTYSLNSIS